MKGKKNTDSNHKNEETSFMDDRIILGRGILHKLSELKNLKCHESLKLYLGFENKSLPIHKMSTKSVGGETINELFLLNEYGYLYCKRNIHREIRDYDEIDDNNSSNESIPLKEEIDFLNLSYQTTQSLHKTVFDEDFYDNLSWRLNNQEKIGYSRIWAKDASKEKKKSYKARNPEDP